MNNKVQVNEVKLQLDSMLGNFGAVLPKHIPVERFGRVVLMAVQTNPAGATVVVDGQQRGATPLRLSLKPGRHVLELVTEGDVRSMPGTITAAVISR